MLIKVTNHQNDIVSPKFVDQKIQHQMYKAKKMWIIKRVIDTNNILMNDFNISLRSVEEKKIWNILFIKICAPEMCTIPESLMCNSNQKLMQLKKNEGLN